MIVPGRRAYMPFNVRSVVLVTVSILAGPPPPYKRAPCAARHGRPSVAEWTGNQRPGCSRTAGKVRIGCVSGTNCLHNQ